MAEIVWTPDTVALGDLIPWERNPRRISKASALRLLKSWNQLGQFQTIAIGPNGEVYDGHQRLSALLAAYGPDYRVTVLRSSRPLSEEERRQLVLAAHAGTVGQWDWSKLAAWDTGILTEWGLDKAAIEIWREDIAELQRLLTPPPISAPEYHALDRLDELQQKWQVCVGDVWEIESKTASGAHRIVCGDSTRKEFVDACLRGQKPLLMVTDPPYGVQYDPKWRDEIGKASRAVGEVANDDRANWADALRLFPGDVAYVWCSALKMADVLTALASCGFEARAAIVWVKNKSIIGRGHYNWQHEECVYAVRRGRNARWIGGRNQSTVRQIDAPQKSETGHSTQKPIECMAFPIRNHDAPSVYDPFLGSGTTILACETLGRCGYGIEIVPHYVAVALQRLEDAGLHPRKVQ